MPARHLVGCLVVSLMLATVTGQRPVLTVGGANPDFLDLPPAVAAAIPGSILEVRPGTYTGFTSCKALRIVLQGAVVQPPAGSNYTITVHGLAGGDQFVLHGDDATVLPGLLGAMRVTSSSAPVVIEGMTLLAAAWQQGLDVFNTGSVHLSRSILVGDPGLQVQFADFVSSENVIGNPDGPGAVISDARFESVRAIYIGTDQVALRIVGSDARLASDGTGTFAVIGTSTVPISPLEVADSSLRWQPNRFVFFPLNGAPPLNSYNTTELIDEVPTLVAGFAPLGGSADVRMSSGAALPGTIAVSLLLPAPVLIGPLGIYLDPLPALAVAAGIVDPIGLSFALNVPNDPMLRGELLCLQGVVFDLSFTPTWSGPATWYLE